MTQTAPATQLTCLVPLEDLDAAAKKFDEAVAAYTDPVFFEFESEALFARALTARWTPSTPTAASTPR